MINFEQVNVDREAVIASLKIPHMHFVNKNALAKRGETFMWEKTSHQKQDLGLMKMESLLGG